MFGLVGDPPPDMFLFGIGFLLILLCCIVVVYLDRKYDKIMMEGYKKLSSRKHPTFEEEIPDDNK